MLKPALNSANPYPATTHPLSIQAVAEVLLERGAKVIVADQSGMESVVQRPDGKFFGSSRANYEKSGMAAKDLPFVAFEEGDWEKDFFKFQSPEMVAWPNGFYMSALINKVDHIINLPRVSTHSCAGATLGFKNLVGFLRTDSRLEFHADGPFNGVISSFAAKKGVQNTCTNTDKFLEKLVELSLAVKDKTRVTLFTATKVQTTFGPDKKVMGIASTSICELEDGLVFASANPVAAELLGLAVLVYAREKLTSSWRKIIENKILFLSKKWRALSENNLHENPLIKNALRLNIGSADFEIDWGNVPADFYRKLEKIISKN